MEHTPTVGSIGTMSGVTTCDSSWWPAIGHSTIRRLLHRIVINFGRVSGQCHRGDWRCAAREWCWLWKFEHTFQKTGIRRYPKYHTYSRYAEIMNRFTFQVTVVFAEEEKESWWTFGNDTCMISGWAISQTELAILPVGEGVFEVWISVWIWF